MYKYVNIKSYHSWDWVCSSSQAFGYNWPSSGVHSDCKPSGRSHPHCPGGVAVECCVHGWEVISIVPVHFWLVCSYHAYFHYLPDVPVPCIGLSFQYCHFFLCDLMSLHIYVFSYCCCWFPLAHDCSLILKAWHVKSAPLRIGQWWPKAREELHWTQSQLR